MNPEYEAKVRAQSMDGCAICGEHAEYIDSHPDAPNGFFAPSHDGSSRCQSGSLASGGRHAHCTCDTCF